MPLVQETNQEVPGWLQGMGARAPSFGGGKRRGGGGNRFGGQDFRRETGGHRETSCPVCMSSTLWLSSWCIHSRLRVPRVLRCSAIFFASAFER